MRSLVLRRVERATAAVGLILTAAAASSTARAAEICVDGSASGGGNGSRSAPFTTILEALAAANPADEIRVAGGTYTGSLDVPVDDLTLIGGFLGAGDFDVSDPAANPTSVVATGGDAISMVDAGDTRLQGLTVSGGEHGIHAEGFPFANHSLVVESCIVENNGDPDVVGGGIYAGVPTIVRSSTIRDNEGDKGAGISGEGDLTLEGSRIEDNIAHGDHGGGIYAYGDLVMTSNVVSGNRIGETAGYGWGGGLILYGNGSVGQLRGNVVTGNYAPLSGSGVFIDDGAFAQLENELIVSNVCGTGNGAAVYVDGVGNGTGSDVDMVNVTIAGHPCGGVGNAILIERDSTVTLTSSIVWGNGGASFALNDGSVTATYTDVEDGFSGTGNLQVDPLFGDAAGGDFHLQSANGRWDTSGACVVDGATSPAIDAGDPAADASGEPPPNGSRIDMGAYGGTALAGCDPGSSTVASTGATGSSTVASSGSGEGGAGAGAGSAASTTSGPGGQGGNGDGGASSATGDGGGDGDSTAAGDGDGDDDDGGGASGDGASGGDGGCGCVVGAGAETSPASRWLALHACAALALAFMARRRAR